MRISLGGKASVAQIVKHQFSTLVDMSTDKTMKSDYIFFFGVPLLISSVMTLCKFHLSDAAIGLLATSFSIFAALLFNLLIMIIDVVRKTKEKLPIAKDSSETEHIHDRIRLLKQLHYTVGFEIVLSIAGLLVLVALIIPSLPLVPKTLLQWGKEIGDFLAIYLAACFVLHLCMVLNRIYSVLELEFK